MKCAISPWAFLGYMAWLLPVVSLVCPLWPYGYGALALGVGQLLEEIFNRCGSFQDLPH